MRTWERLRKTKRFFYEELCKGREMKCPVPSTGQNGRYGPDIKDFTMAEPRVFLTWQPMRPNEPGRVDPRDPFSVCPAITIMPMPGYGRYVEERRFDRYSNIHRNQDLGQGFNMQVLFSIYEPGIRLPGFADGLESGNPDMGLMLEGTEEGLKTLLNWMDDATELLLRTRTIPGADLAIEDNNLTYSLFTDQAYVVDKRPVYYGFLNVSFVGYASKGNDHGRKTRIDRLLDE